ncbi:hypothetical protein CHS0354_026308 [Potamilus streckersoni]|uniref:Uncharacterized protein n=1 Tax=Potamilus streckersoni TaxID=2493646 RepID=A0AAE0TB58_9BIVA|nr:hypothetical protein CHS0354_026308 [Potamilus streckersoni]
MVSLFENDLVRRCEISSCLDHHENKVQIALSDTACRLCNWFGIRSCFTSGEADVEEHRQKDNMTPLKDG